MEVDPVGRSKLLNQVIKKHSNKSDEITRGKFVKGQNGKQNLKKKNIEDAEIPTGWSSVSTTANISWKKQNPKESSYWTTWRD